MEFLQKLFGSKNQGLLDEPGLCGNDHTVDGSWYAYANTDSDFDGLINGFEDLIGTNKNVYDSDCDGAPDGTEILRYDTSIHGYTDPLEGPCGYLFVDGFEVGSTERWSLTSFVADGIGF